jgi:hypothetical protein
LGAHQNLDDGGMTSITLPERIETG